MSHVGENDLHAVLMELAERARALVCARVAVIELAHDGELVIAAGAGELPPGLVGRRLPVSETVASVAMRTCTAQRLDEPLNSARLRKHGVGRFGVRAARGLAIPLLFGGQAYGALLTLDATCGIEQEQLLEAVALGAAAAVSIAATAAQDRQRQRVAAAEEERRRWARDLHDETLQGLAAIRLQLSSARREDRSGGLGAAVDQTLAGLQAEIDSLRGLITTLRPAVLDELGLEGALRALADRASRQGTKVDVVFGPGCQPAAPGTDRNAPNTDCNEELELAIYRITQEALTNACKHGQPGRVTVELRQRGGAAHLSVSDDGSGFECAQSPNGFGLIGMREHAELLGGSMRINSRPGRGTTVQAILPSRVAATWLRSASAEDVRSAVLRG
jgi:signal transduction histidine kinase